MLHSTAEELVSGGARGLQAVEALEAPGGFDSYLFRHKLHVSYWFTNKFKRIAR